MVIFVEGPDETGKTHIAKALCEEFGLQYWKNEDNEEFEKREFHTLLKFHYAKLPKMCKLFQGMESGVVFDRNFITEAVYSKVFNRPTYPEVLEQLNKDYAELKAVTVYCYKTDYRKFEDPHVNVERMKEIEEEYMRYFMNHIEIPTLMLDTTDENLQRQIKTIKEFLMRRYYGDYS